MATEGVTREDQAYKDYLHEKDRITTWWEKERRNAQEYYEQQIAPFRRQYQTTLDELEKETKRLVEAAELRYQGNRSSVAETGPGGQYLAVVGEVKAVVGTDFNGTLRCGWCHREDCEHVALVQKHLEGHVQAALTKVRFLYGD